jgi:hypothetical protein
MRVTTNALAGPVPATPTGGSDAQNSHTGWTSRWGLDTTIDLETDDSKLVRGLF